MPKKLNFLGGMQNYNKETGEYESALVGKNGKVVKDADGDGKTNESDKVKMSQQETRNKLTGGYTRLNNLQDKFNRNSTVETAKDTYKKLGELKEEFEKLDIDKSFDFDEGDRKELLSQIDNSRERIARDWNEVLEADFNEPGELEKQRVEKDFNEPKNEFKLDKQKYPDVEETPYGFIYNVNGISIEDIGEHMKKSGMGYDPSKKYGFSVAKDGEEYIYETFEDAYKSAKEHSSYPKGTSKEYTDEVNKKYSGAVDTLKKAGIKTDFKNFEEINKAQKDIMSKWEESKDDAKYKPLYEALEIVEDKMYNDDFIRLAPYGY